MSEDSKLEERSIELLRARLARERAALRTTKLKHYEACVVEWLGDLSTANRAALRGRFEHGISNATDDTLSVAYGLVREIVQVIDENDAEGFRCLRDLYNQLHQIDNEYKRIRRALGMLKSAIQQGELGQDVDQVPFFRFMMRPYVERFASLDSAQAHEVLRRVKLDAKKGGRGNLSPTGALAELFAMCGAFGCQSAEDAKAKILKAVGQQSKTSETL